MPDAESSSTFYGHEDRLQRLESGQSTLQVAVGEHGTHLEYITKAVDEGFKKTSEAISNIAEHFDESIKPVTAALADHTKFIEDARASQKQRAARWSSVKKAVLAVVIAGGGVAVKEFVVYLFHILKA